MAVCASRPSMRRGSTASCGNMAKAARASSSPTRAPDALLDSSRRSIFLFAHRTIRKPLRTFRSDALERGVIAENRWMASSRAQACVAGCSGLAEDPPEDRLDMLGVIAEIE